MSTHNDKHAGEQSVQKSTVRNQDYLPLHKLVELIDQPNRAACSEFLAKHAEMLKRAKGSNRNHQAWEGGYLDHLTEVMNIAVVLYYQLDSLRPLPFTISDALLVLFLHDIEKPWKQQDKSLALESGSGVKDDAAIKEFKAKIIGESGFVLTKTHKNAIDYAEGEGLGYTGAKRVQTPLAAFVHMCDVWSARGWYNHPSKLADPWKGALRGGSTNLDALLDRRGE